MSPELADLSLLELFSMELRANRQAIEDGLVGIDDDPRPERLEPLMRAAHSIKGAARIVNLGRAVGLAHAMEDVFQAAGKGLLELGQRQVDALLAANDYLGRLADAKPLDMPAQLESTGGELDGLEASLRGLLEERGPGRSAPSSGPGTLQPVPESPLSPSGGATSQPGRDREVRLQAETLGRLMGLAGQCLVEAGTLGRILARTRGVRRGFMDLAEALTSLRASLQGADAPARLEDALSILNSLGESHEAFTGGLDGLARRMELVSGRLYNEVLGSRMRPFGEAAKALPRLARDLSRELGKKARFTLEGSRTAVDKDILERLEAPLMHLARNALDHGLESPEARLLAGKPEKGRITLSARHVSGHLEVRFADDGRGIDPDELRRIIVERGLAAKDIAGRMSTEELFGFLFLPGFTTAPELTEVSGRGVGLDVVMAMLQEAGGQVRVESAPGEGTAFVMRLPVSRSVLRALVADVGGEPYALALSRIGRVVSADPGDILSVEGRQYLDMDGASVGLAPAAQILGLEGAPPAGGELCVVVLETGGARFGLVVDAFLGERDLVVHPLDPRLGKVPGVSAASMLDDGSPVLILDDADLARSMESLLAGGRLARVGAGERSGPSSGPKRVLVVDDSLTVREVERQLLAGRGYEVQTAVDGMEGLALARMGGFDLIVTDVDMPRMTGIELTRRVKSDPALASTPVMIVSYKDRQEDRLAGLDAGADHYLAKSGFSDKSLLDAVLDLVGEP